MKTLLKNLANKKIIRMIDFIFSQFISTDNNAIMLAAACISFESSNGYISLSIEYFQKNNFFSNLNKKIIKKILLILKTTNINWLLEFSQHHAFSNGNIISPLVFYKNQVYLYKMWKSEKNILQYLKQNNTNNKYNSIKICELLSKLFPTKEYNNQKVAVALCLINKIIFILGGPGTGKTTTIIKIIIVLIKNSKKNIKIQLSAPTGKATTRLIEILNNHHKIFDLYISKEEKNLCILKPVTIHKLLGISEISNTIFFNKKNPLNINVLIIDEVSMINVLTMNDIINAIKENTKIIFIGDYNQLSPIGIGSILHKIYNYSYHGYSLNTINILKKITKYSNLSNKINNNKNNLISDKICVLTKNYRFQENSSIHLLSNAIYKNNIEFFKKVFNNLIKNILFNEINGQNQYINMIDKIIYYHRTYWRSIQKKENIKENIKKFKTYQVLCIVRDDIFGINNINNFLEKRMYEKKIIKKYFYINNNIWYIGKPIIVTKNNKYLGLSNGDIGITYINTKHEIYICFLQNKNDVKYIPVYLLEYYETAWCITVHKAQGSEFDHITLILPNQNINILNKKILYTAVTRSRKKLSIFSKQKIFITSSQKV